MLLYNSTHFLCRYMLYLQYIIRQETTGLICSVVMLCEDQSNFLQNIYTILYSHSNKSIIKFLCIVTMRVNVFIFYNLCYALYYVSLHILHNIMLASVSLLTYLHLLTTNVHKYLLTHLLANYIFSSNN